MLQIAAEIVLDGQIALVDRRHPGKRVHVVENLAVLVMNDGALRVPVRKSLDVAPGDAVGDFLDGEVEFVAGDEIDGGSGDEALFGLDRDFGADEADFDGRIDRLDHLGRLHVRFEGRAWRCASPPDRGSSARERCPRSSGDAAAHRSASSLRPGPRAAPARSDTRTSGPRASSDSGRRRRRRSRRMKEDAGTAFSSSKPSPGKPPNLTPSALPWRPR